MELVITKVAKSESVEIVARIGEFMGVYYLDIREFNVDGPFKGPSKRGIRLPIPQAGEFIKTLYSKMTSDEFLAQLQTMIAQEASL